MFVILSYTMGGVIPGMFSDREGVCRMVGKSYWIAIQENRAFGFKGFWLLLSGRLRSDIEFRWTIENQIIVFIVITSVIAVLTMTTAFPSFPEIFIIFIAWVES